jgi:hypothetical protein
MWFNNSLPSTGDWFNNSLPSADDLFNNIVSSAAVVILQLFIGR